MLVFIAGKSPPWSCTDDVMALSGWPAGPVLFLSLSCADLIFGMLELECACALPRMDCCG